MPLKNKMQEKRKGGNPLFKQMRNSFTGEGSAITPELPSHYCPSYSFAQQQTEKVIM
jgi:hypothetical protein